MELINHIQSYWIKGSSILVILAFCSIFILYYTIYNFFKLNNSIKQVDTYIKNIDQHFDSKQSLVQIISKVPKHLEFIKNMLNFISQKNANPIELNHLFAEIEASEIKQIKFDLILLGAFIGISPLLGLLGTVFGMIQTFNVLSLKSSLSTNLIAEGISQALITTQFGLIVALPGIFGNLFVIRKLKIFNLELSNFKQHLLIYLRERHHHEKV